MDPDQNARMRRLVWIHAGRKPIMLVLSWRGSLYFFQFMEGGQRGKGGAVVRLHAAPVHVLEHVRVIDRCLALVDVTVMDQN
jgi:hypothetical protein